MFVENRIVSIRIHEFNENINYQSTLNEIKFPLTTENYTYGIVNETKIGNRVLFDFVCLYEKSMNVFSNENGKLSVFDKYVKQSSFGKFSINNGKLELFNCGNLIKGILENEFGKGHLDKFIISDEKYSKLYDQCFVKTSGAYVLNSENKSYKVNIQSDGVGDNSLHEIFQNPNFTSTSFNGRMMTNREISFKLNKNGTLLFYNSQKSPLTWDDIYNFIDEYVY